jgi:hypothetical protein
MASGRDDLGDFYRLPADILGRCADDVAPTRPTYTAPLSQQGLHDRPDSLDAALTHLRLSPHPALVLAIEGDTEYRLVPGVMDTLALGGTATSSGSSSSTEPRICMFLPGTPPSPCLALTMEEASP